MSVVNNNLLLAAEDGGYVIDRSLRFRSSASAYLNRTPASAGNRKTMTFSMWVKRGSLATSYFTLFSAGAASPSPRAEFGFNNNAFYVILNPSGSSSTTATTNAVFRDASAWYHIVVAMDTTQATSTNRLKVWVNSVEQTFSAYAVPTQNTDLPFNNNVAQNIGRYIDGSQFFDGYLTEVNFIDGQALTPDSFGEYNEDTGVWQPKKYAGTYGTNGFYLNFSDPTNTTTLTADQSGNGNNWTANNISLTSGATYDSMIDTPTPVADVRGNFAVLNPLAKVQTAHTFSNANLTVTTPAGFGSAVSTIAMSPNSGQWYCECIYETSGAGLLVGLMSVRGSTFTDADYPGRDTYSYGYYSATGNKFNVTGTSYGSTWTVGDIIGIAYDSDTLQLTFYKNGVSQGVAFTVTSDEYYFAVGDASAATSGDKASFNFGQRPFAYTPPSGFKALHTGNLPEPAIVDGKKHFDVVTRSGFGSSGGSITSLQFRPDFLWNKTRNVANSHNLIDSVRGTSNIIYSNLTSAEASAPTFLSSFNGSGYTIGTGDFATTTTLVDWLWKAGGTPAVTNTAGSITSTVSANPTAGFSIVTYTGTGTAATVGHGLGVAPRMVIVKSRSLVIDWAVYHASLTTPSTQALFLNLTNAATSTTAAWNSTNPTSSVFSLGNSTTTNTNGASMVAYCFAEVEGYSKFGSMTGNGSTDGTFVYLGFSPAFVMIKRTDSAGTWYIMDNERTPSNLVQTWLKPNSSDAESTGSTGFDFTSNGFKLRSSSADFNASGGTYIYMAFAENPTKYALAR